MTEKNKQPEAGATELNEEELGQIQGGYANLEVAHIRGKKADGFKAGADLQKK